MISWVLDARHVVVEVLCQTISLACGKRVENSFTSQTGLDLFDRNNWNQDQGRKLHSQGKRSLRSVEQLAFSYLLLGARLRNHPSIASIRVSTSRAHLATSTSICKSERNQKTFSLHDTTRSSRDWHRHKMGIAVSQFIRILNGRPSRERWLLPMCMQWMRWLNTGLLIAKTWRSWNNDFSESAVAWNNVK